MARNIYEFVKTMDRRTELCEELFKSRLLIRYIGLEEGKTVLASADTFIWNQHSLTPRGKAYKATKKSDPSKQIDRKLERILCTPVSHAWNLTIDQMIMARVTEDELMRDAEDIWIFNRLPGKRKKPGINVLGTAMKGYPYILLAKNGDALEPCVLPWLLMLHHYNGYMKQGRIGLCPEAKVLLKYIDRDSLSTSLIKVLVHSKVYDQPQMISIAADACCRYADHKMLAKISQVISDLSGEGT